MRNLMKKKEIRQKKHTAKRNSAQYEQGKICGTGRGFAFFRSEKYPDIFIAEKFTKGAIDGDQVLVKIISFDGEKGECRVEKILQRANSTLVGVLIKLKKEIFFKADNAKIGKYIKIEKRNCMDAKVGDKVVCKILYQPENVRDRIIGAVVEVLGDPDKNEVQELSIVRQYNIFTQFPQQVLQEASKLEKNGIKECDKNGRVDLTNQEIFTIDGEDAKDFDDAVSLHVLDNGNYLLGVHIADVGNYVKKGTPLDEEAFARGTSVYFPTMVFAMLPEALSNGICSLQEDVERLTLSVEIELDKDANVKNHKIFESVIKSNSRLTYNQVYDVLTNNAENKASKHKATLILMDQLSKKIKQNRQKNGEIDFDIPECEFVMEGDKVVDVKKRERNDAHKLIENFMVLANEVVAKHYCDKNIPFAYRVHEKPTKEKLQGVVDYLRGIGINVDVPDEITALYYTDVLKKFEGNPLKDTLNKLVLRSMQKAKYSPDCLGHFGLGLQYYCHFTSPIRRYPDLTIHRIIKDCLHEKKLPFDLKDFVYESCEQSSNKERNADEAERAVDDLKKAQYMKNHIGEVFEGVISSVTNFGFFVELENTIEGLVKIESLPEQKYLFFEKSFKLKGQKTCYSLGDKIKIKVISSNIYDRKIEFALADDNKN